MSNQRIFYKIGDKVGVLTPAPECLLTRTIEEIAEKDVPAGLPYKIGTIDDYPDDDFEFIDAWEMPDDELTDGVGADRDTWE